MVIDVTSSFGGSALLQQLSRDADLPAGVLALTPVNDPAVVLASLDAGAADYLPITAELRTGRWPRSAGSSVPTDRRPARRRSRSEERTMNAEDWSADTGLSRWEAVEAEARQRLEGEAESTNPSRDSRASTGTPDNPSWWQDPAADRSAAPVDAQGGADPAPGPDARPHVVHPDILLADADHAIGASLEQAMTDQGWTVRRVLTGDQALAEFRRQAPDCFVFDYSLPGIGGLDLLRQLAESGLGGRHPADRELGADAGPPRATGPGHGGPPIPRPPAAVTGPGHRGRDRAARGAGLRRRR